MIFLRLIYCNSLYYGLLMDSIQKFQRISNACRLIIRLSPGSPTANFIKQLQSVPRKQRVLLKIIVFGQRLVHHPWKIFVYFGALVLGNYKAIRCQNAYNSKSPYVSTAFGRRSFSFDALFEWDRLPFKMKLITN